MGRYTEALEGAPGKPLPRIVVLFLLQITVPTTEKMKDPLIIWSVIGSFACPSCVNCTHLSLHLVHPKVYHPSQNNVSEWRPRCKQVGSLGWMDLAGSSDKARQANAVQGEHSHNCQWYWK